MMLKHVITTAIALALVSAAIAGLFLYKRGYRVNSPAVSSIEQTLAIIKPDAVEKKHVGAIINLIEQAGFSLVSLKKTTLSKEEAESFYDIHAGRPFFKDLVTFMSRGPVVVMVLEKKDAVTGWRDLMGSTNPTQAKEGTIRKLFATDVQQNAVHGSDSKENAAKEIQFFFSE